MRRIPLLTIALLFSPTIFANHPQPVTEVPTAPSDIAIPKAIGHNGNIVVESHKAQSSWADIWTANGLIPVKNPLGSGNVEAADVYTTFSGSDIVAVTVYDDQNVPHAALFNVDARKTTLLPIPESILAEYSGSIASSLYDPEVIGGWLVNAQGNTRGFIYNHGVFTPVLVPGNGNSKILRVFQNSGVGSYETITGRKQAFLFYAPSGSVRNFDTPVDEDSYSTFLHGPYYFSGGYLESESQGQRIFLNGFAGERVTLIPSLPNYPNCQPLATNWTSEVVGFCWMKSTSGIEERGFIIPNAYGHGTTAPAIEDINNSILTAGWNVHRVNAINSNQSQMAAVASFNGGPKRAVRVGDLTRSFSDVYVSGTPNNFQLTPMKLVWNNTWELLLTVSRADNERFHFALDYNNYTGKAETMGDNDGDGYIDLDGKDIPLTQGPGVYKIRFRDDQASYGITKTNYTVLKVASVETNFKRTVVFMHKPTVAGQDLYLRGGIDWGYSKNVLKKDCALDKWLCAIPVTHNLFRNDPNRINDRNLDWYGPENGQSASAFGSPLVWTTNNAQNPKSVASHGYGYTPLNKWGNHYWMLDAMLYCNKTVNGWFELKAYLAGGSGWEQNVSQAGAPYISGNHFAQCGKLNKFSYGSGHAEIYSVP